LASGKPSARRPRLTSGIGTDIRARANALRNTVKDWCGEAWGWGNGQGSGSLDEDAEELIVNFKIKGKFWRGVRQRLLVASPKEINAKKEISEKDFTYFTESLAESNPSQN
jgi:hypothetical protein